MPPTRSENLTNADTEDWALEILQALLAPSTAEDAALATAAAWMNFVKAERVAVAVFPSSDECVVAHGQRDNQTHVTVYVGREKTHIAALLSPATLCTANGPCQIDSPTEVICWPEHFAAIFVKRSEFKDADIDDERLELVKKLSRQLLSRWTSPSTTFASPEQMESLAEFAAGAGHEINNPLGSIIGQTQLLLKRLDRADQKQALETIGSQAWRIRDMIGDTMLFARPPQPEFEACNLLEIAEQVVATLNEAETGAGVARVVSAASKIQTFGDEVQLATLLSHLIRNAFEATRGADDDRKEVVVRLETNVADSVVLTVEDKGPEVSDEVRRHMFDPFYSGRQAGRGLGFGLCHCWQIARMHNGILLHEEMDGGNRFLVVFPAA